MKKQNLKNNYSSIDRSIFILVCSYIVVLSTIVICGCAGLGGYSNQSLFPADVETVYLEMFDNQTFRRGAEYELTDALAKRIGMIPLGCSIAVVAENPAIIGTWRAVPSASV